MGYNYNNKYSEKLIINASTPSTIEVVNNEDFIIDFTENTDKIKIYIDYGDGKTDKLVKPIVVKSGAINVDDRGWMTSSHFYGFKNESDFSSTASKTISIRMYDIKGNCTSKSIRYSVKKNILDGQSRTLEIISANITNKGDVSYVINNTANKQIIFLKGEK
jgi:hypothetical protein